MRFRQSMAICSFWIYLPVLVFLSVTPAVAASIEVPRISIEQAKQIHDDPQVIFIDVRSAKSWWRSANKISRAVREKPGAERQWAPKYPKNKTLIFY